MIDTLTNRRILLIISGGIAAYKSLDLIRKLRQQGATAQCVLTKGGSRFVTPLSVSALSGNYAYTDLWSLTDEAQMGHIRLSREADVVVVAPASANLIAKMAHGAADDLASTILLATDKAVMIAPSMNVMMWQHAAVQTNIALLKQRGVSIIDPTIGDMACGEEGAGRMAEVPDIIAAITAYFVISTPLSDKRALITSGPTFEPLDPVRFIGNRSSGKQGHAIAVALQKKGVRTTLVTGPTQLPEPPGVKTIHVQTAREMLAVCEGLLPVDLAICAAAVADWRPAEIARNKLKKDTAESTLQLIKNPDILATICKAGNRRPRLVIGFAAETENVLTNAAKKFESKGCDWILANEVGENKAFDQDDNQITFLQRDANGQIMQEAWPRQNKDQIARQLVDNIIHYFSAA
jgi:phosphopantothenoylcysteine decarboxylase/phosphopantothenate--cysteine ligase